MLTNTRIQTAAAKQSTSADPPSQSGIYGDTLVSEYLGKYANLTLQGNVFWGSTAAAGTIIPVNASNLVSTFTLYNPLGSGRNLLLISYDLGLTTGTAVIGNINLVFQAGVGAAIALPTSQTALVPTNGLIGAGNASQAKLLSA